MHEVERRHTMWSSDNTLWWDGVAWRPTSPDGRRFFDGRRWVDLAPGDHRPPREGAAGAALPPAERASSTAPARLSAPPALAPPARPHRAGVGDGTALSARRRIGTLAPLPPPRRRPAAALRRLVRRRAGYLLSPAALLALGFVVVVAGVAVVTRPGSPAHQGGVLGLSTLLPPSASAPAPDTPGPAPTAPATSAPASAAATTGRGDTRLNPDGRFACALLAPAPGGRTAAAYETVAGSQPAEAEATCAALRAGGGLREDDALVAPPLPLCYRVSPDGAVTTRVYRAPGSGGVTAEALCAALMR